MEEDNILQNPQAGIEPKIAETLSGKLGVALELSMKIKEILNINVPSAGKETPPANSKVGALFGGTEILIDNLVDIKKAVLGL